MNYRALTLALASLLTLLVPTLAHADPPRASAPVAVTRPVTQGPSDAAPAEGVVNVNTASAEELVRVPGIGPARADAVLRLRERAGGRFRHIDDLLRVRGIGRVTLRRMRPYLTLDGPTTLDARPGRRPAEPTE